MNYPPKHHQEANFNNIIATIETYPLATLISAENSKIFTTHLPLIYEPSSHGFGKLIGHIDKFNPQVKVMTKSECSIIFNGPQTYISPSIYTTKQLPTWNYIKAHLKGNIALIEDAETVKETIVKMTEALEQPQHKYKLEKDDSRMHALIDYIVGFEIEITAWEGKYKLSQDKNKKDQKAAKEAILNSEVLERHNYIDAIYKEHQSLR